MVSDKWQSARDAASETAGRIFSETFQNIRVVRAFTLEQYFETKHEEAATAAFHLGLRRFSFR